jgi:hypothetical protein
MSRGRLFDISPPFAQDFEGVIAIVEQALAAQPC